MDRLERLEKIIEELSPRLRRYENELELLKDLTSDLIMSAMEDRRNLRELREILDRLAHENSKNLGTLAKEMEAFKAGMEAFKDEMRTFKDEINKKWGELANRLGTLTEDIFAPGIPYLAERLGYKVKKRMLDVEYKKDGMYNQYDAIVVVEDDSGNEIVFVAEVKSQLRADHFDHLKKKLENLVTYEPAYANKKIVPILAAFKIPEDLIDLADKRGVLLVRMGGDYLEPLNPHVIG